MPTPFVAGINGFEGPDVGWIWTLAMNAPIGVGAWWAARRLIPRGPALPVLLATAALSWAWITLGCQLLGTLELLTRGPCLAWALLGLGCGAVLRRRGGSAGPAPDPASAAPEGWAPAAWISLGLLFWSAFFLLGRSALGPVKVVSDGPIYHLYFAAKWWRAGRIFLVPTPFGESAAPYFPATGDLWFSWLMVGWGGDQLAKVGQAPFLILAGLAAVAIARRLGAGPSSAVVATCLFLSSTPLLIFSFEANVDTIFVAGYLVAVFFLVDFARNPAARGPLLLAGLAAGLALGCKPTSVVFVPPLLVLGLGLIWLRGPRPRGISSMVFLGSALAVSGYWFAGNALRTGNPLYPLHLEWGGRVLLPGWFGSDVMRRNPLYYIPVTDWGALADILLAVVDPRIAPFWVAAVLFGWWFRVAAPGDRRLLATCAALAVLNVAIYWLLVPYRTQQRFMLQAFGLAAAPLALLMDRARWLRPLAVIALALHTLTLQTWPVADKEPAIPWDLAEFVPNAVLPILPVPTTAGQWRGLLADPAGLWVMLGLAVLGLANILAAWALGRAVERPGRRRWAGALIALAVPLALSSVAGLPLATDPRRSSYPAFDFQQGWLAMDDLSGPRGGRIAYAGTNLPYYLMGAGFRNEVLYVNVDDHPGWLMHDYHRRARDEGRGTAESTRPGWDREHADFDSWWANLGRERIEWLVVTRANPLEGPFDVHDAERFPIERAWADDHPDRFKLVYGRDDPIFRIYRVISAKPES